MNKVVLISGMRQVGKTTLALAIADAVSARTLSSRLSTCTWRLRRESENTLLTQPFSILWQTPDNNPVSDGCG